jgi:LmbE family N-acetylglucosaminyl deacetylase
MTSTVLHFSPHPDDELLGAPATLMAMRDAGHRVVTVACSLGRRKQAKRREEELRNATDLAGFELVIPPRPVAMSSEDNQATAQAQLLDLVRSEVGRHSPMIIVSPSPHDRHPGHELVGRAVRETLGERAASADWWWMWGLWAPLPLPTLGTTFDEKRLGKILTALSAHEGELARNNYRRLLRGRAEMNAVLAPEMLFGFGAQALEDAVYAELLTEVSLDGQWLLGEARWLDPAKPVARASKLSAYDWLFSESLTRQLGPPRAGIEKD